MHAFLPRPLVTLLFCLFGPGSSLYWSESRTWFTEDQVLVYTRPGPGLQRTGCWSLQDLVLGYTVLTLALCECLTAMFQFLCIYVCACMCSGIRVEGRVGGLAVCVCVCVCDMCVCVFDLLSVCVLRSLSVFSRPSTQQIDG